MKEFAPVEIPSVIILGGVFACFLIIILGLAAMIDEENPQQKLKDKEKKLNEKEDKLKEIEKQLSRVK